VKQDLRRVAVNCQ